MPTRGVPVGPRPVATDTPPVPPDYPEIDFGEPGGYRTPRVLVLGNGTSPYFALQNDQWVRDAMLVDFPSTTYVADWRTFNPIATPFSNYDSIVWMFDCDNYSPTPSWLSALFTWVEGGGGLVVTEWLAWMMAVDTPDNSWHTAFDPVLPILPGYGVGNYNDAADFVVTDTAHPTMRTLGASIDLPANGSWYASQSLGLRYEGVTVATTNVTALGVQPAVVVRAMGTGLFAWANYAYFGDINPGSATALAQLMRNLAWWAAGGTVPAP